MKATATGVGSQLTIYHNPGGASASALVAQVLNVDNHGIGIAGVNSGSVTYTALKGSATAFNYFIYVVGFFRSY